MKKLISLLLGTLFFGAIGVRAATWPGSSGAGGFTGGTVSGSTTFLSTVTIGGGNSVIRSTQAALTITVNDVTGTGSTMILNQSSVSIPSGGLSVGTSVASGFFDVRQATWTAGTLVTPGMYLRSAGALYNASDIVAGQYILMINTGTIGTSGNVGHILGSVIRSSDTASGSAYSIAFENRNDAFGEANYYGNLSLVHGQHPGITTSTLVAYGIDLQSHLMDDSTNNSSGTLLGVYFRNFAGGNSTSTWAWYNPFSAARMYQTGNVGIGVAASQPGTEIDISNGNTGQQRMTTTNPTMQSTWYHIGTSSVVAFGTLTNHNVALYSNSVESVRISSRSVMFDVGTTTPGVNASFGQQFCINNGGTAEIKVMDGAGNITQISPHDAEGNWKYDSVNVVTGKSVFIPMEELVATVEQLTGRRFKFSSESEYKAYRKSHQ